MKSEGWLFKYRSQILPELSPFPELLHFPESQLPVYCVDNLDPPVRRALYVPAMQIIEKYELVVDLPDSRSSAYLRDDP